MHVSKHSMWRFFCVYGVYGVGSKQCPNIPALNRSCPHLFACVPFVSLGAALFCFVKIRHCPCELPHRNYLRSFGRILITRTVSIPNPKPHLAALASIACPCASHPARRQHPVLARSVLTSHPTICIDLSSLLAALLKKRCSTIASPASSPVLGYRIQTRSRVAWQSLWLQVGFPLVVDFDWSVLCVTLISWLSLLMNVDAYHHYCDLSYMQIAHGSLDIQTHMACYLSIQSCCYFLW